MLRLIRLFTWFIYEESIWDFSHSHTTPPPNTHTHTFFPWGLTSLSLHTLSLLICDLRFWFSAVRCPLHPIMCLQPVTSFRWQPDPTREEPRTSALPSLNYRQITFPFLPWLPGLIFQLGGQRREEMTWGRRMETRGWTEGSRWRMQGKWWI